MNSVSDELLARAGLAEDQHCGVGNRHFLHVGENLAQRLAAADDLIGANQRTDLLAQVFGFDRQRANFLLGLQPLIHISKYEGVERLAFEIETRQRRFRLKTAAVIVGRRETTGNP